MAPTQLQHRRIHNLLLISKLLKQKDASSPFTLIFDSLEQSARLLLIEYIRRAHDANVHVIFVSFETIRKPHGVNTFVDVLANPSGWHKVVTKATTDSPAQRKLLLIDSLNALASSNPADLASVLSSFMTPTVSICATYHKDVALAASPAANSNNNNHHPSYAPSPIALLRFLATTVFTVHALHHVLARKIARERSQADPVFGLDLEREGILQSLGANGGGGSVLEMDHRRRSGRGVHEWYFLPSPSSSSLSSSSMIKSHPPHAPLPPPPVPQSREGVILLQDHPQFRPPEPEQVSSGTGDDELTSTFDLKLTEKQRLDRDGVVLPYFDAQTGGGGEGGRILYDMGSEDDFDEEEDEI